MKNCILILFVAVLFSACGGGTATPTAAAPANLTGFTVVDFPGSKFQKAMRAAPGGNILEEGELFDGKKTGTWVVYHDGGNIIANTITNYVDGKKNGLWMRIGTNNRVEAYGYYADDLQDGTWVTYNYSRRETEKHYKAGQLHGVSKTFHKTGKDGQVKEEIEYKNGVQDGIYRYYLEDGSLSVDYVYKNGEVVERKKQG